jgi:hypothetical protein
MQLLMQRHVLRHSSQWQQQQQHLHRPRSVVTPQQQRPSTVVSATRDIDFAVSRFRVTLQACSLGVVLGEPSGEPIQQKQLLLQGCGGSKGNPLALIHSNTADVPLSTIPADGQQTGSMFLSIMLHIPSQMTCCTVRHSERVLWLTAVAVVGTCSETDQAIVPEERVSSDLLRVCFLACSIRRIFRSS